MGPVPSYTQVGPQVYGGKKTKWVGFPCFKIWNFIIEMSEFGGFSWKETAHSGHHQAVSWMQGVVLQAHRHPPPPPHLRPSICFRHIVTCLILWAGMGLSPDTLGESSQLWTMLQFFCASGHIASALRPQRTLTIAVTLAPPPGPFIAKD